MVALSIDDLKSFTKKLFLGTDFDDFLLTEAKIVTFNSFTIDGRIRRGFYTEEEAGELKLQECSFWKTIRPICFSLIKGKRLPGSFHISLQANHQQTEDFLTSRQIPAVSGEQIKGLYLHIRYDDGKLFCITGSSLAIFTMDKTLDREWDAWVEEFLKKAEIAAVLE